MFKNFKILSGTKDYWSNFFTRQHVIQWELFSLDFVEQVPGEIRGVHEHGSEPGTDPLQPVDPGNPTQSPGHQEGHQGSDCHVLRAGGCVRQHDGGQGQEAYLSFLFCHQLFLVYRIFSSISYWKQTFICVPQNFARFERKSQSRIFLTANQCLNVSYTCRVTHQRLCHVKLKFHKKHGK